MGLDFDMEAAAFLVDDAWDWFDTMSEYDRRKLVEASDFILEMKLDWPDMKALVLKNDREIHELRSRVGTLEQRVLSDPPPRLGSLTMDRFETQTGRYEIAEMLRQYDEAKEAGIWRAIKKHGAKVLATLVGAGMMFGFERLFEALHR